MVKTITASEMGKLSVIKRMGITPEERSEYMKKVRKQGIDNKKRQADTSIEITP